MTDNQPVTVESLVQGSDALDQIKHEVETLISILRGVTGVSEKFSTTIYPKFDNYDIWYKWTVHVARGRTHFRFSMSGVTTVHEVWDTKMHNHPPARSLILIHRSLPDLLKAFEENVSGFNVYIKRYLEAAEYIQSK